MYLIINNDTAINPIDKIAVKNPFNLYFIINKIDTRTIAIIVAIATIFISLSDIFSFIY